MDVADGRPQSSDTGVVPLPLAIASGFRVLISARRGNVVPMIAYAAEVSVRLKARVAPAKWRWNADVDSRSRPNRIR